MTDASTDAAPAEPANGGGRWIWPGGLSARLLLLTVLFALAPYAPHDRGLTCGAGVRSLVLAPRSGPRPRDLQERWQSG